MKMEETIRSCPTSPNRHRRQKRVVSLDSSVINRFKTRESDIAKRSKSASDGERPVKLMKKLSFENIDLLNTPLSSLRSCSEFNHYNRNGREEISTRNKEKNRSNYKNYLFRFFHFIPRRTKDDEYESSDDYGSDSSSTDLNKNNTDDNTNFNSRNNYINNRDNIYYGIRRRSICRNSNDQVNNLNSSNNNNNSNNNIDVRGKRHLSAASPYNQRYGRTSTVVDNNRLLNTTVINESYRTIDYLFGVGNISKYRKPMEIELKTLKVYNGLEDEAEADFSSQHSSIHINASLRSSLWTNNNEENFGLRRNRSNVSLPTLDGDDDTVSLDTIDIGSISGSNENSNIIFNIYNVVVIRGYHMPYFQKFWAYITLKMREFYTARGARPDEYFYEYIRVQPFSSGSYLRGMLVPGFSGLYFNLYNVAFWPESSAWADLTTVHVYFKNWLYCCLLVQLVMNIIQLPLRLAIHFQCWESSRALSVESATNTLRTMITSDTWMINRFIGFYTMFVCVVNLIVSEAYLWFTPLDDPLRTIVISLTSTNLLIFVTRIVCGTAFAISLSDPQVLNEARRRGLTKIDIDSLHTFVFTNLDEVNNDDCSICLSPFEMGEMLISLPCDRNKDVKTGLRGIGRATHDCCSKTASATHSFHAPCIREWLARQNSCPLCNRIIT